ncbi:hypothetical protein [Paraburkholderia dinghuensis]|nr:hypothetical protein [Paraburkholderia dinghuensis]
MIQRPSAPNPANEHRFQRAASATLFAALVLVALMTVLMVLWTNWSQ